MSKSKKNNKEARIGRNEINNVMPVVLITDDNYAMPTAVAITSLYCNKKQGSNYAVYIICTDVSQENMKLFKQLSKDDFPVELIVSDGSRFSDFSMENFHVSPASINKFELPNIFPQYDKILYLDSDMLVLSDLTELFSVDIEGKYAAVVKDYKTTTYNPPILCKLHIEDKHEFYFNSGMMLLNLKKMRNDGITEKLYDYRKNGINYFMDQDALNVVFEEEVVYVDVKYNTLFTVIANFSHDKVESYYDIEEYESISNIIDRTSIVHLAGIYKPWEHLMPVISNIFMQYYEKSPYAFQPLQLLDNDPIASDKTSCGNKVINVVYVCENKSAKSAAISLTSMYFNKKPETAYNIYIFCNKLTADYKMRLADISKENFDVHIIDVDKYDYDNIYAQTGNAISPVLLTQTELPILLPMLDKAIFITNDTLVLKDLRPLFDIDIESEYAAVVRDFKPETYNPPQLKKLNLSYPYYFSNGVMLLNLKKIRDDNIVEKCLCYRKYGANFLASDAYNVCFEGKVKYISYYFNASDNIKEIYKKDDIAKTAEIKSFYSFSELYSRCYIIYFNRKEKPWNEITPVLTDMYVRYFIRSPFSDLPYDNGMDEFITQVLCSNDFYISSETDESDSFYSESICRKLYPPVPQIRYVGRYSQMVKSRLESYADVTSEGFNHEKRDKKIIVSLTTIPFRIDAASCVISIMMHQTLKPDMIVLYLGQGNYKNIKFPELLEKEQECGVQIKYREDIICHTKYFYAMQEYPDEIIITVDDDILYDETLIENLYNSYLQHPNAVSAMRAHQITYTSCTEVAPYRKWKGSNYDYILKPSHKLLATGVGGVLYPPHCLHEEVFNLEKIKALAPKADDIWLKIMEIMNDTPVVIAKRQSPLEFLDGTQEVGLCYDNVNNGQNDIQFKNALNDYAGRFPDIPVKERLFSGNDPIPMININEPKYDSFVLEKITAEKLNWLRKQKTSLENKIKNLEQSLKDPKRKVYVSDKETISVDSVVKKLKEAEGLKEKIAVYDDKLNWLRNIKAEYEVKISVLENNLKNYVNKNFKLKDNSDYLHKKLDWNREQNAEFTIENKKLIEKLEWNRTQKAKLEDKVKTLENDLKTCRAFIAKKDAKAKMIKISDDECISEEAVVSKLCWNRERTKELEGKVKILEEKVKQSTEETTKLKSEKEQLSNEITNIRNSMSMKIGRAFTWLPRKIKGK